MVRSSFFLTLLTQYHQTAGEWWCYSTHLRHAYVDTSKKMRNNQIHFTPNVMNNESLHCRVWGKQLAVLWYIPILFQNTSTKCRVFSVVHFNLLLWYSKHYKNWYPTRLGFTWTFVELENLFPTHSIQKDCERLTLTIQVYATLTTLLPARDRSTNCLNTQNQQNMNDRWQK